jgi:hypothetical protein
MAPSRWCLPNAVSRRGASRRGASRRGARVRGDQRSAIRKASRSRCSAARMAARSSGSADLAASHSAASFIVPYSRCASGSTGCAGMVPSAISVVSTSTSNRPEAAWSTARHSCHPSTAALRAGPARHAARTRPSPPATAARCKGCCSTSRWRTWTRSIGGWCAMPALCHCSTAQQGVRAATLHRRRPERRHDRRDHPDPALGRVRRCLPG